MLQAHICIRAAAYDERATTTMLYHHAIDHQGWLVRTGAVHWESMLTHLL
jgi:hypothetical protein